MNKIEDKIKDELEKTPLSRRDALKLMAISPVAAAAIASSATTTPLHASSDAEGKIVIVGGGAGAIMVLSRLRRALSNPDITIIAPNEIHIYQPGQVFVAAGEMEFDDLLLNNSEHIPDDVNWIKDEVATFDADNNKVVTRAGEEVSYDYLVVATGIVYHYDWIKGLSAEDIGKNGISSVYLNDLEKGTSDGATATQKWFEDMYADAKAGKKPKVVCTQPKTPIKCGGAPQKILYLSNDNLHRDGLEAEFTFATYNKKLFSLPAIDKALFDVQKSYGNITNKFAHNLIAVDTKAKKATFSHLYEAQGEYDEDFEIYEMVTKNDTVVLDYDYLHVVPPMSPPDAVVNSSLASQDARFKGWLDVDKHTLQHNRYKNVFGIGDVLGTPMGKTGGSARHQGPIVVENLVAQMEAKKLTAKFDGYTVCPLKTHYGKIIMAEFNYGGLAPTMPLDPAQERWMWWAFDLYMLKPMYKYLMLPGYF